MNELDELTKITQRTLQLNRQNNPESATRANPPPSWSYSDKRLFALEKRELFGRHPLLVGFSCDIAKPGDFFTLDDLDVPVLITRDNQGQANALLNICSVVPIMRGILVSMASSKKSLKKIALAPSTSVTTICKRCRVLKSMACSL